MKGKDTIEGRPRRWPPLVLALAEIIWLLISVSSAAPPVHKETAGPVQRMVASLEDEVKDLPQKRIAWSTFWKLCWDEFPGARGYELQTLTSEGRSPRLHRQVERCFRIQVAAGENLRTEGLVDRKIQLLLQSGQLAYRVRAVFDGERAGEWSPSIPVGKELGHKHNAVDR